MLVTGGRALDTAAASRAVEWIGLAAWVVGVATMAVPAVAALTGVRIVVPAALPMAVVIWVAGADTADGAMMTGASAVAAVVALSSPIGRTFVQASAYGDEDRHVLRPPIGYGGVAVLAWAVWVALCVATGLGVASQRWIVVVVFGALTVTTTVLATPRWHRLSRRWVVLVPAGVVVHDPVVLAETVLLRRPNIEGIGLAFADTVAADLTGPAAGHALEIRTREPVTVLVDAPPARPRAIHLTGCLVAPSRPGQVLAAASRRRLPVGAPA